MLFGSELRLVLAELQAPLIERLDVLLARLEHLIQHTEPPHSPQGHHSPRSVFHPSDEMGI